jgi:hypothetical protein
MRGCRIRGVGVSVWVWGGRIYSPSFYERQYDTEKSQDWGDVLLQFELFVIGGYSIIPFLAFDISVESINILPMLSPRLELLRFQPNLP